MMLEDHFADPWTALDSHPREPLPHVLLDANLSPRLLRAVHNVGEQLVSSISENERRSATSDQYGIYPPAALGCYVLVQCYHARIDISAMTDPGEASTLRREQINSLLDLGFVMPDAWSDFSMAVCSLDLDVRNPQEGWLLAARVGVVTTDTVYGEWLDADERGLGEWRVENMGW